MEAHARAPPWRRREAPPPPRFANPNPNRLPKSSKSSTNGYHYSNGRSGSSALCTLHSARMPRKKQIEIARQLLTHLTSTNSEELALKLAQLQLSDDSQVVAEVARLIFEKAVEAEEVEMTRSCAKLVHQFVRHEQKVQVRTSFVRKLRKYTLDTCQAEFLKTSSELDGKEVEKAIVLMRFISELYRLDWLTPRIIVEMVETLLGRKDCKGQNCEQSLYQLSELLTSIGELLENKLEDLSWKCQKEGVSLRFAPVPKWMDKIWDQLKELKNDQRLGASTRRAMALLVKVRENKWNWSNLKPSQQNSEDVVGPRETVADRTEQPPQHQLPQQEYQETCTEFSIATSNRFQFLRSPPPPPPVQMDFYPHEQQSLYCGPTFLVPVPVTVTTDNALEVAQEPQLNLRIRTTEAEQQLEVTDTQAAEAILHHYLATNNFENAEDLLILREFFGPDRFHELISFVVGRVTNATSKEAERRGAAELIKSLVESDRNVWTFKDVIAAVQRGDIQGISTTVEEHPKAALHLTTFLARVLRDEPRFGWIAPLASGLEDAVGVCSRAKSVEVLRNAVTVLSSMFRL